MNQKKKYAVIGGDTRLYYTALHLASLGLPVLSAGSELLEKDKHCFTEADLATALQADTLLFGLPFSKDGTLVHAPFSEAPIPIKTVIDHVSQNQRIFAGMLMPAAAASLREKGAEIIDYYKDMPLILYNAMLTAEAITGILIGKLPCALFGADIAITGYGRIGFYLARSLKTMGANITVFARDPIQRAKARTVGISAETFDALNNGKASFRALVNAVPSQIIRETELDNLNPDCLLIEAAGAPYGIDADAAANRKMNYYLASGLPGKYAPESAGRFIAETILRMEREVTMYASP